MRYFVQFSYLGTDFHGSQTQPNGVTVQEVLEKAFFTLLRHEVPLTFAGRTDAGVHAEQMFAHFDLDESEVWDDAKAQMFCARLNNLLPSSVAVARLFPVEEDAHARFSATARTYQYRLVTHKSPFLFGKVARVADGLDFQAMNQAATLLLGRHDFASFCKVHTDVKTTFCEVSQAQWNSYTDGTAVFTITADRFLRNMVRAVVGTLLDVGRGKLSQEDFRNIIAQKNRCAAGQSAPAEGLYLTHVAYPFLP